MNNSPNNNKEKSPIKVSNASMGINDCEDKKFANMSEDKLILDLLLAPMSPNQVSRHLVNVFKLQRKCHKIRQVLLKNKGRIKCLNSKFDFIACRMLSLLEIDETFKGRKISLLVVIDTMTGYIFHLQWLKSRSKKGILNALASKRELFYNVVFNSIRKILTTKVPRDNYWEVL